MRGFWAGVLCAMALAAPAQADVDVIAQAGRGVTLEQARAAARAQGLVPHLTFRSIRALHLTGPARGLRVLRRSRVLGRVQRNVPLELHGDTSHEATGSAELLGGAPPIDGTGVGVGIIDSGLDGTHPDFSGRVATNMRVVEGGATVPIPVSDVVAMGGHGTHVSGIAAGSGAASGGRFHGAAPGATLHVFSMGAGKHLVAAVWAWDWILEHNDELEVPIRVINHSFGSRSSAGYRPGDLRFAAIEKLLDAGVTMVFSAGNEGGDGKERMTGDYCLIPKPGAICVAGYDDADSGTRDGTIYESSSRGEEGEQDTYPDLMAPAERITAPCRPFLQSCTPFTNLEFPLEYAALSGTSMAAPHVTGIVAQLLQARPDLTPAQVEAVLVRTAHRVKVGASYAPDRTRGGLTSFDKGHGLVDARAAVDHVTETPGPPAPASTPAAPPAPGAPASTAPGERSAEPAPAPAHAPPRVVARRRGSRLIVDCPSDFTRVPVRVLRGRRVVARGTWRSGGELVLRVPRRGRLRVEANFGGRRVRVSV